MSERRTHELKTWREPFQAMQDGAKTFEYRKDDRCFLVGDVLYLREYCNDTLTYTGRRLWWRVTYVIRGGHFGVPEGYCVMSLAAYSPRGEMTP